MGNDEKLGHILGCLLYLLVRLLLVRSLQYRIACFGLIGSAVSGLVSKLDTNRAARAMHGFVRHLMTQFALVSVNF